MANIPSLEKDQVEDIAKDIYEKFEKETNKVPEWVKVMAHSPKILKEFTELFKVIMGKGEIGPYLKWKMAYTVSQTLKCPFCVDVTEKMLKKLGANEGAVKNPDGNSEIEEKVLELVKDITDDACVSQVEVFEKLRKIFSEAQIVEIISVIGLFNYINRFNNTLGVLPE